MGRHGTGGLAPLLSTPRPPTTARTIPATGGGRRTDDARRTRQRRQQPRAARRLHLFDELVSHRRRRRTRPTQPPVVTRDRGTLLSGLARGAGRRVGGDAAVAGGARGDGRSVRRVDVRPLHAARRLRVGDGDAGRHQGGNTADGLCRGDLVSHTADVDADTQYRNHMRPRRRADRVVGVDGAVGDNRVRVAAGATRDSGSGSRCRAAVLLRQPGCRCPVGAVVDQARRHLVRRLPVALPNLPAMQRHQLRARRTNRDRSYRHHRHRIGVIPIRRATDPTARVPPVSTPGSSSSPTWC
jgi:hypothetical protein